MRTLTTALMAGCIMLIVGCGGEAAGPAGGGGETAVDKALARVGELGRAGNAAEEDVKTTVEALKGFFKAAGTAESEALAQCILSAADLTEIKTKCQATFSSAVDSAKQKILDSQPKEQK